MREYPQQFSIGTLVHLQGLAASLEAPVVGQSAKVEQISTTYLQARYLIRFEHGLAFWVYRENLKELRLEESENTR